MKTNLFLSAAGTMAAASLMIMSACSEGTLDSSGNDGDNGDDPDGGGNENTAEAIEVEDFGATKAGEKVDVYSLRNKNGITARVSTYGATLVSLDLPDKDGNSVDVVTGFDSVEGYEGDGNQYFGCTTGRVCNRIAKGKFTLDDKEYTLAINNDPNHLHGGEGKALSRQIWTGEAKVTDDGHQVVFSLTSLDGDEGYPGNLQLKVTYTLTDDDELRIDYWAKTDKSTPVNLTNHAYWNLGGVGIDTVLDHELTINADQYTPTDDTLIPTGKITSVEDTPLDFRKATRIGARIPADDSPTKGYDHNFVVNGKVGELREAATLKDPKSGRVMQVLTDQPGLQFYSGNFLKGQKGKNALEYKHRSAVCLETQHFPDSVNQPDFPSIILKPDEEYKTTTIHRFSAE